MRVAVCLALALCLAQAASGAKPLQAGSPGPTYNTPGLDFSFILPGQNTVIFTQASFSTLCTLIDAATAGSLTCLGGVWANVSNPNGLKVFGQAYYTFPNTPTGAQLSDATTQRDALLAALKANTPAILGGSFPGATLNCDASISSSSNVAATGGALYYTGTLNALTWAGVTAASSVYNSVGSIAPTPVAGALAQLVSVNLPGPTGPLALGIDVGRYCTGQVSTGTWAPACDNPLSPGFASGLVYVTGSTLLPRTSYVAVLPALAGVLGAVLCPRCYTSGGATTPFTYNGPNKGKYCTLRTGVLGAVTGLPLAVDVQAFDNAGACVAVGVWTPTFATNGVPAGSQGTLCVGQSTPLFSGISLVDTVTALTNIVTSAIGPLLSNVPGTLCQALGVSSLTSTPCSSVGVTTGAAGIVQSPGVVGNLFAGTCNTVSTFTSILGRTGPTAGDPNQNNGVNQCLLLAETFTVTPTQTPSPGTSPAPAPGSKSSPDPSASPAPTPSPGGNSSSPGSNSPGGAPGGAPGGSPGGSPGSSPGGSPGGSPGSSPGSSPGDNGTKSPGSSPGSSPGGNSPGSSPSLPNKCKLAGTYQIIARGRTKCTPTRARDYLVYLGGSTRNCNKNVTMLRKSGLFKDKRSFWKFATNSKYQTNVLTVSRGCRNGENGLSGYAAKKNTKVVLAGRSNAWQLRRIKGSCTNVNLIELKRSKKKYPAFLSSSSKCKDVSVFMTSKDYGTGRQQWTLLKVTAKALGK